MALKAPEASSQVDATVGAQRTSRLAASIRSPLLIQLYELWQAARGPGLVLPTPAAFPLDTLPGTEHLAVVAVDRSGADPQFRIASLGAALAQRADRPKLGESIGEADAPNEQDPLGSAAWAYRRSLDTRLPTYEYGYFNFGKGPPFLFERLLLPVGHGGRTEAIIAATLFGDGGE